VWKNYKPVANGTETTQEADSNSEGLFGNKSIFGSTGETSKKKDEMQRYLSEPRIHPDLISQETGGVLQWWKVKRNIILDVSQ